MSLERLGRRLRRRRRDARRGADEAPADAESTNEAAPASGETAEDSTAPAFPSSLTPVEERPTLEEYDPAAAVRYREMAACAPEMFRRLETLDAEQAAAVLGEDTATVVEAQVGSGKTRVLIEAVLVAHLVDGVPLERIAVLTFTRKAAREIEERLAAALGRSPTASETRLIGTFHSVARVTLDQSGGLERLGRRPGFEILDAGSRGALLRRLVTEGGLRVCYPNRLERRLEAAREGRVRFGTMKSDDDVLELSARYEAAKRDANLFDFDDLVRGVLAVAPAIDEARRPQRIFVDELQDASTDLLDMVAALAGPETRHFAVGDPRQVIYSWRGSVPDVFREYRERFAARSRDLVRNHRTRASVLAVAASVLGAGAGRMRAAREGGEPVVVRKHHDDLAESRYLAGRIAELVDAGTALDQIAILVRTRDQIAALAPALREAGTAVRAPETESRPGADWFVWLADLLRAVLARDDEALVRLDRDPRRGRRRGEEGLAASAGWPRLRSSPSSEPEDWIEGLGLRARLRPTRAEHARELNATRRALTALLDPQEGPEGWERRRADLESRGAWDELLPRAEGRRGPAVPLMTMHAAKGLEFDHVFLSGVNEGVIPLAGAGSAEARMEERRLLFVALTRARESAEIGWRGRSPLPRGEDAPSSFLDFVPMRLFDRRDGVGGRASERGADPALGSEAQKAHGWGRAGRSRRDRSDAGQGTRASPWRPGLRIRHRDYGEGVIEAVDDAKIVCRFGRRGRKTFSAFFCPLEIIEEASS